MISSSTRLFTLACLSLALTTGAPQAHAQNDQVTVWLYNEPGVAECSFSGESDIATRFTTGSEYLTVETVEIAWGEVGADGAGFNHIGIFAHDNITDAPGATQIGGWLSSDGPTQGNAKQSYNNEGGPLIQLTPNTDYWVVLDIVDGSQVKCNDEPDFSTDPNSGNPTMSHLLISGEHPGTWRTTTKAANLVYSLSGSMGNVNPPNPEDMSVALQLPLTGVVGQPYSGTFTCQNIGDEDAKVAPTCQISGLPDFLGGDCTISPNDQPWDHHDEVPAGETVTCRVEGIPDQPGTFNVTATTGSEGDFNFANNIATLELLISATDDGPGSDPGGDGQDGGNSGGGNPGNGGSDGGGSDGGNSGGEAPDEAGAPVPMSGVVGVPTLSEWGALLLTSLLLGCTLLHMRRKGIV